MVMEDKGMVLESNNDESKLDLNIAAEVESISEEKTPYEMLGDSKSSIEEIVAQILDIKKMVSTSKSQLRELFTQIFLHFITLRQANRSIMIAADTVKSEMECAKAPLDMAMLKLHEFKYERSHYLKAIEACKVFNSDYPNIELLPEEEFSQHIKSPTLSNNASHDLMMKRLNYELCQRKELCNLHEKLKLQKKSLTETVASRKKFLSSLPSHLKSLKKASLPVQNQLGIQHANKLKQHQLAELLPQPLYVVYSQFLAQKEAFGDNIDVEILGSVKDAQSFARHQANNDTGGPTTMESLWLDGNAQDEEDDGQRKRKRPRMENFDHTKMCEVHPLRVILHIYDPEASDPKSTTTLVTLNFEYLLKLNVVCVGVEGSHEGLENTILCNLFPDDTGFELPHQSGKLIVGDAVSFNERSSSRPYKWAQHLAGIDILPEASPLQVICETQKSEAAKTDDVIAGLALHRQHNLVQTFVQRIRSKTKAQQALV